MRKLFDKSDSFSFLVIIMPHIESNILQKIFYSAIKGNNFKNSKNCFFNPMPQGIKSY